MDNSGGNAKSNRGRNLELLIQPRSPGTTDPLTQAPQMGEKSHAEATRSRPFAGGC